MAVWWKLILALLRMAVDAARDINYSSFLLVSPTTKKGYITRTGFNGI